MDGEETERREFSWTFTIRQGHHHVIRYKRKIYCTNIIIKLLTVFLIFLTLIFLLSVNGWNIRKSE
jgi:hypothetical protein